MNNERNRQSEENDMLRKELHMDALDEMRDELRDKLIALNKDAGKSSSHGYLREVWCDVWWRIQTMLCGDRFVGDYGGDSNLWNGYDEFIPCDCPVDPVRMDWLLLLLERLSLDEMTEISEELLDSTGL